MQSRPPRLYGLPTAYVALAGASVCFVNATAHTLPSVAHLLICWIAAALVFIPVARASVARAKAEPERWAPLRLSIPMTVMGWSASIAFLAFVTIVTRALFRL